MSLGCDYNSQAVDMTCTVNQSGGNDDTNGPVTAVLSGSEVAFVRATVVEGASLLSGGGSATAAAAPVSTAASATTGRAASSRATGLMIATGSPPPPSGVIPTASASAPATASTGAAAKFGIEGSALLALAGVAALNVL